MPPSPEPTIDPGDPAPTAETVPSVHPLKLAGLFVQRTKLTCSIACAFPILSIVLIILTGVFNLDTPGSGFLIRNDIRTRLNDARTAALEEFPFVVDESTSADKNLTQQKPWSDLDIYILLRGRNPQSGLIGSTDDFKNVTNVLTRDAFALLKKAEDLIWKHPKYPTFCLRDPNPRPCKKEPRECVLPTSFLNDPLLYGIWEDEDVCSRKSGNELVSQANFDKFIKELFTTKKALLWHFSNNISESTSTSWTAQTVFKVGGPFRGYEDVDENQSEQDDLYLEWAESIATPIEDVTTSEIDVYPIGAFFGDAHFDSIVNRDLSFSIAAIVLVFIVIWLHTSSAFLATIAMLQIMLSFPLAYAVYHFVFRQLYFSALQILTIFLILGIGADDVFVFTDAWKQAATVFGPDVDLVTRMSWTYRRSVKAMTVTSFTTAAAFFVTAISPIMSISTLGVWAGVLILFQYALVITIYPCAVIIWHRFWRPRLFVNFFRKLDADAVEQEVATPLWQRFLPKSRRKKVTPVAIGEYRLIERFFRGGWFNFLQKGRFFLIAIGVIWAGVSIWLATGLEPPEVEEDFLPSDHPVNVARRTLQNGFPRSDADLQLRVSVTWGIKDVNRAGTSRYDVDNTGVALYDKDFDMTKAAAQEHVLEACAFFEVKDKQLLFTETDVIEPSRCWIKDYRKWRKSEGKPDSFTDFDSGKDLVAELIEFGNHTDDGFKPYFKYLRDQDIAFDANKTRVVFTEIRFVSPTDAQVPYRVMWPVYTKWRDELEKLNKDGPKGVNQAIVTGGYPWMWQMTQRKLVQSMFTGIGIMLAVALVTLTLATMNWAVAILATLCIGGIVATLLAMIRLYGWSLGTIESIGVVISIGYSFDGAAHIASAYIESKSRNRIDRTRDALTDLGISILFGAISTLCAGVMLFPAIIVFFVKFASIIVSTLVLSLVWSLALFPALLLTIGPENDFGCLITLGRRLIRRPKPVTTDEEEGAWNIESGSA